MGEGAERMGPLSLSLSLSLSEVKTDRWTDNFCERVTGENLPSVSFEYMP